MNAVVKFQTPNQQMAPAFSMSDMERVALAIAKGGLFGSSDPNAVLTLCMLAQAEGQHPAVVFRDYHIISGKPAKKSEAMQRDFLMSGGKIEWHRLEDECVDATFSHPQGGTVRIAWDNARVQQAQLTGNAMHKKYPRQMKKARVIAEGVRTIWPSATSGLYEPGEIQDIVTVAPRDLPKPEVARDLPKPARQTADQWAAEHIAAVNHAPDFDALEALISRGTKPMGKLAADNIELHQNIGLAYEARRVKLEGEGKAADQMGEAFATDEDAGPF